jgi:UDP-glucose 4-epimerase
MRYLVTGGSGFIGSHLCETLVKRGDSVSVIDNLSTGSNKLGHGIDFVEGSIFDQDLMAK